MPSISMFYGIIIYMYYRDHYPPHFHAVYQDFKAVYTLDGELMEGKMPAGQNKLIAAWAVIHADELRANWELAEAQEKLYKIEPLR